MTTIVLGEKYSILKQKEIGLGACGKVYECQLLENCQLFTSQQLCVKEIDAKNQSKAVINEQQISSLIKDSEFNANLVQVYNVSYQYDQLYVVMERCNSNLEDEWWRKKQFNDEELLDFLEQFINGYQVLYDNNIIHRDLKPENILINTQNNSKNIYKISDFGTSKIYKHNEINLTKVGTPIFAPPETNNLIQDQSLIDIILNHKKEPHFKSRIDIYSLGIMLHQIYLGTLPFEKKQKSIIEFFQNLKATPFKIGRQANKSEQILSLIESMIQYFPDKRISFPDLKQKCFELKNYNQQIINFQQRCETRFSPLPNNLFNQKDFQAPTNIEKLRVNQSPIIQQNQKFNQQPVNIQNYRSDQSPTKGLNSGFNQQQIKFSGGQGIGQLATNLSDQKDYSKPIIFKKSGLTFNQQFKLKFQRSTSEQVKRLRKIID